MKADHRHDFFCLKHRICLHRHRQRSMPRYLSRHPFILSKERGTSSVRVGGNFSLRLTARERVDAHRLTDWGKAVYKRRKETVERSFADAKQLHGHRSTRFRSLWRVRVQCLLAAAAQNIKKIALTLTEVPTPRPG